MANFDYPAAVELARLPTPLVSLERFSAAQGVELLCKRDDLTGVALSGNKIRKLEFLLAQTLDRQQRGVITCGGAQSNHARATALSCARLGLRCKLLLRTEDPARPPATNGNILLDRLAGATIDWISPEQWIERDALMQFRRGQLDEPFEVIPEGGSNALGAWGYVRCVEELAEQLGSRPATVVYPVGSGGTAAGLIAGCRLFDLPYRLVGVCVCDDRQTFQRRIASILAEMSRDYRLDVAIEPEGIELWQDYVGRGYALSCDSELKCIADLARSEGLITDPVYTGKAFHGLRCELARGRRLPEPIVFLHTGGIFGLFGHAEQISGVLDADDGV